MFKIGIRSQESVPLFALSPFTLILSSSLVVAFKIPYQLSNIWIVLFISDIHWRFSFTHFEAQVLCDVGNQLATIRAIQGGFLS